MRVLSEELSNEYQHDMVKMIIKSLPPCALEEKSLSIGRVNSFDMPALVSTLSESPYLPLLVSMKMPTFLKRPRFSSFILASCDFWIIYKTVAK